MQRLILRFSGFCIDLFYKRTLLGERVPEDGPILLVGNHPNGLIDPVLLASTTDRPLRFLGKAPLFDMPGIGQLMRGARALPVYRAQDGADTNQNAQMFDAVFEALGAGDVVCLFPEGKSHNEPGVQPLRTGAARMALGAEERSGFELGVRVVPVGLSYRANRRFRSRVAVWVGDPIDTRPFAELHGTDERAAVRALTEAIESGLEAVTLGLERWEDLPLFEWAERILVTGRGGEENDGAAERYARLRRFADGVRALRAGGATDIERVDELARRIACFRERLERFGATVEHLDLTYHPLRVLRFALRSTLMITLGLPLALIGMLVWAPPYLFVPWLVARLRPTRDVHATYQLVAGMVLFPLWAALLIALVSVEFGAFWALLALLALGPLGLLALGYSEWRGEAARDLSVFFRLGARSKARAVFAQERDLLAQEIEELRRKLESDGALSKSG